jgi:hypothetical protein
MPDNHFQPERRAFPRWHGKFKVEFKKGSVFLETEGLEIDEDGLLFRASNPPGEGDEVELRYLLPGSATGNEWVSVRCRVCHVSTDRVGVQFLNCRLEDRERIIDAFGRQSATKLGH